MKNISILYNDKNTIKQLIKDHDLNTLAKYFIRIYTADATKDEAVNIANDILDLLPNSNIIGGSSSGVIYNGEQYNESSLVVIEEFESIKVLTKAVSFYNASALEVATLVNDAIKDIKPDLMHVFCSDHYYDVHNFVCEFNKLNTYTKMVGGVMGDVLPHNIEGYVFTPDGIMDNCVLIAALYSDDEMYSYSGVNIAHEAISPTHTLTSSNGAYWNTVNEKPAYEWFFEQLGITQLEEYTNWQVIADNDVLIRFPIILNNHNGASRFLKYDSTKHGISQYFSHINDNTKFRIGYVSPSQCVKESFNICNEIMTHPMQTLFCYSCLFRRLYLNNCAKWELSPYKDLNICGAFMMGEIGNINGTNEFLNGACCIVGIAEKKVYVRPNIKVFDELEKINDDTRDLLNLALKKQSENVNKYNQELLHKLVTVQKHSNQQLFIDFNTGIANYLKYKDDLSIYKFNKICMVKIENSDLITTLLGHEGYTAIVKKAIVQIRKYLSTLDESALLFKYIFNENTFFVTSDERISDNHFIEIAYDLFNKYQFLKITDSDQVLINRFVVVLNQDDLIEIALNTFQANKNIQTPFVICQDDNDDNFSSEDEFNIIGVLNRALESDGVVPYFQGIYDNSEHIISKYEALMRIIDVDGTVYSPAQFMGVAKKYHLYIHLSKIMIEKVIDLFSDKKESVSINCSVNDLHSEFIQNIIYNKLSSTNSPSNIVLEILEDEEFRDIVVLKDFITTVKKFGVKIAIDDFGAGYSNLLEITNINPDYLKVDGSIIKEIDKNEMHKKILDVIIYLGEHFNMDIIAEYVENSDIQNQISQTNIRYSQGYLFSKPQPFEELGI